VQVFPSNDEKGQCIQVARGDIILKTNLEPFAPGELFFDYTTKDLWVGGTEKNPHIPMNIGGLNTLRFIGEWSENFLPRERKEKVLPGYIFLIKAVIPEDIDNGVPAFSPGDFALFTKNMDLQKPKWIKLFLPFEERINRLEKIINEMVKI